MNELFQGIVLGLHLMSAHIPATSGDNNFNLGVYAKTAEGWTAGAYRNTLNRNSVYFGKTWAHGPASLTVAAVTGYQARWSPVTCESIGHPDWTDCWHQSAGSRGAVTLLVTPSLALPAIGDFTPRLSYIPKVPGLTPAHVLHFSIERPL